jgi:hypothetical protein
MREASRRRISFASSMRRSTAAFIASGNFRAASSRLAASMGHSTGSGDGERARLGHEIRLAREERGAAVVGRPVGTDGYELADGGDAEIRVDLFAVEIRGVDANVADLLGGVFGAHWRVLPGGMDRGMEVGRPDVRTIAGTTRAPIPGMRSPEGYRG